jgi:hypothetical protein
MAVNAIFTWVFEFAVSRGPRPLLCYSIRVILCGFLNLDLRSWLEDQLIIPRSGTDVIAYIGRLMGTSRRRHYGFGGMCVEVKLLKQFICLLAH